VPTASEPNTTFESGWVVRIQPPTSQAETGEETATASPRNLLLLHGWTGNETVMWIFTHNLPPNTWIFSPRGPVAAPEGGYGWVPRVEENAWPALSDFEEIARALMGAYRHWSGRNQTQYLPLDVMGFSQGAAMAYALATFYPRQIDRLVALAGFLPTDGQPPGRYSALNGKKIYIAHGTQDDTVPVQMAHEAVQVLQEAGAQVTYCESNVGHKLGVECLRGLREFLA
jgi:phospholipase/carboxylesterase